MLREKRFKQNCATFSKIKLKAKRKASLKKYFFYNKWHQWQLPNKEWFYYRNYYNIFQVGEG
jgi:hypothetical protein